MVRMGPRMGPTMGPVLGPSPSFVTAPAATIYEQATAANVNAYLQGLLASASDFTPDSAWNFDNGSPDAGFGASAFALTFATSTTDVARIHGAAFVQGNGADQAIASGVGDAAFTTAAWCWLVRIFFDGPPDATRAFLGRGTSASAHYALTMDVSGQLIAEAKQSGPPTTATLAGNVADGTPRWIACWRSVTGQVIGVAINGASQTAAFANVKDLTNAGATFALGDTTNNTGAGGADCYFDHLLMFTGSVAETVVANVSALLTALEAAE